MFSLEASAKKPDRDSFENSTEKTIVRTHTQMYAMSTCVCVCVCGGGGGTHKIACLSVRVMLNTSMASRFRCKLLDSV